MVIFFLRAFLSFVAEIITGDFILGCRRYLYHLPVEISPFLSPSGKYLRNNVIPENSTK